MARNRTAASLPGATGAERMIMRWDLLRFHQSNFKPFKRQAADLK